MALGLVTWISTCSATFIHNVTMKIMRIGPRTALRIRKPLPAARPLNQIPPTKPANRKIDIVSLLLEERQSHR